MKIATTSICKNESKFIQSWYDALKNEVDYITVLDTGSTDNTYELLQELAKKDPRVIIDQKIITPWSFADARNEAMKLLPKDVDVFISIDMDETFKPGFSQVIKDNWTDKCLQMMYKFAWNHRPDGSPLHTFVYTKIVKNDGLWEWKYPVHETLVRKDTQTYPPECIVDVRDKILLDHWQDTSVDRSSYLDLLKLRFEQYQGDMDALYYARECVFHKMFEEAIRVFSLVIEKEEKTTLRIFERAYINYMTGLCYYQIKETQKAISCITKAIRIDPTYRDPYIDLARIYMAQELNAQAEYVLQTCLQKTYRHFEWVEINDVWGMVPYDLLSVASFNIGHKKTALIAVCKALMYTPENAQLKSNYEKILGSIEDKEI